MDACRELELLANRVKLVSESLVDGSLVQAAFRDWPEAFDMMRGMQQDQLMGGLRSDGEQITPSMTRDPFFRDMKSALRYADRKARVAFDPRRGYETPNLFINGYFHQGFYPIFRQDEVYMDNLNKVIPSRTGRGENDLYRKYGEDTFGLTEENWDKVLLEFREQLRDTIETNLQR